MVLLFGFQAGPDAGQGVVGGRVTHISVLEATPLSPPLLADEAYRNLIVLPIALGLSILFAILNLSVLIVFLFGQVSSRHRVALNVGVFSLLVALSAFAGKGFLRSEGYLGSMRAGIWQEKPLLELLVEWSGSAPEFWSEASSVVAERFLFKLRLPKAVAGLLVDRSLIGHNLKKLFQVLVCAFFTQSTWADHPLITDHLGTQGTGDSQAEFVIDRVETGSGSSRSERAALTASFAYGVTETIDILVSGNRVALKDPEFNNGSRGEGFGDGSLGVKWRYSDVGPLSLGIKLSASIATGNEQRGLGLGRSTQTLTHILQWKAESGTLLTNVGITNNGSTQDERRSLWSASVAWLAPIAERLTLAVDVGAAQQPSTNGGANPAFALVGLIFAATDKVDIDIGYKHGLNREEPDHQLGVGFAVRW